MTNRFPLILDVTDGNKIKEIPAGDNLTLQGSSIVQVQDITAFGTINAADIRLNGDRLVAQSFSDLVETPSTFTGFEGYFVKVNAAGSGLDYRPLDDIGEIQLDELTVIQNILPGTAGSGILGSDSLPFQQVSATNLKGNLLSLNNEMVFNASTGKLSYAAVQGAPSNLSEFTDDIGFLQTSNLGVEFDTLFASGITATLDISGSVFADDSSILVDGISGIIKGNVDNISVDSISIRSQNLIVEEIVTINNLLKLAVLENEPINPQPGMIAIADGTGWDPITTGLQTLVVYLDNAWKQIQTA